MADIAEPISFGLSQAQIPKATTPSKASNSCSECLRRKQKCDKQWPCRHCQDRRAPHLCDFRKRRVRNSASSKGFEQTVKFSNLNPVPKLCLKRKISYIEEPADEAIVYASRQYHLEKELEGLNTADHGRNSMLREILEEAFSVASKTPNGSSENLHLTLDPFPPRPYTDILIYNFLDNINFVYLICHRESLVQEYDGWWQTRHLNADNELEGLLFRLMAISAQFLPLSTCERLESVMAEDIITLKQKWHQLAEARHRKIRPGEGGLKHVQQVFLSATFYKTEALFVDSWHALSTAIHLAQELGMHMDSKGCTITAFEREIRRQVWCNLYAWDRLTAFVFDRPPKICGRIDLVEPEPDLQTDPKYPDLPSPLLSRVLEMRLASILNRYLDDDMEHADSNLVAMAQKDIKEWLRSLPPVFCLRDAITSWDLQHPRITFSRLGLHLTAYSALFAISKPCLANGDFPRGASPSERERLRALCIEYCIRLIDAADLLTRYAPHARFFMAFCLFETSATVCAAVIKDKQRKLPQRNAAIRALGRSKDVLDQLSPNTTVAQGQAKILNQLLDYLKTSQPDTNEYLTEGQASELDIDHGIHDGENTLSEQDVIQSYSVSSNELIDDLCTIDTSPNAEQFPSAAASVTSPEKLTDPERLSAEIFKAIELLSVPQTSDWHDTGLDLDWLDTAGLPTGAK